MLSFIEGFSMYWTRYFDFKGRSTRSEFWWSFLGLTIITGVIAGIEQVDYKLGVQIYIVYSILTIIPNISQYVRRFRDIGISPYLVIITFVIPSLLVYAIKHLPWYLQAIDILLILSDIFLSILPSKDD
ncbi:DUF805 domain-containing protein [Apilactobacillus kunkeei]|uniref:DUF805 domain-containing protein n=1 Tax=Apilactobacillus kunkeei TaxID=148814 RepID=A0AAC9EZT0_9LACO|nr:DUF805 domain-containing protein [Apilactobacillus kunkeei]ALJ31349.1 hypothetical protein APS55_03500 [Apilactobacillus kunkeei]KFJ15320.1 hypothetical protein JI66_02855 [Apilactobacillus kunkeei]KOY68194.1 uncharacterized protein RZ73_12690 [Apilactobacillus kunkeei]CAI2656175.1 hypothetical protein AKUA2101_13520 [Apilactobacillus kunkeei]CAI2656859.1 hypothetical protein AKUH3B109M_13270 [Apilactobacillus kunkeei]